MTATAPSATSFRVTHRLAALLALVLVGCSKSSPPTPTGAPAGAASPPAPAPASASAASSATPAQSQAAPSTEAPKDLNVLLITVDSMRADMPWAGYPRAIAPTLTALEQRSVSYTRGYALSSYTSMSVGGFLAGRYPGEVKRDGYFFGTYPKDVFMFPEALQAAGVRTMGVQAHGYFKEGTGLSQGFDVWRIVPGLKWNAQTDENITSPKMLDIALELLGDPKNTSGRFFFWAHWLDPHDQYMGHKETTDWGKKGRDLYDGEIEYTDQHLAKLLAFVEAQPWAKRTVLIVSADHGESFGEHGVYRHGFEVYENLVHVPWFFVAPGLTPRRIATPRSHLDLAPTILDLLGVPPNAAFPGVSLVPELYGADAPARTVLVDLPRTSDNDRRRALVTAKHKVIAFSDDAYFRVYDLEADPDEKNDLVKTDKETARALIAEYKAATASIKDVKPYACKELKGTKEKP